MSEVIFILGGTRSGKSRYAVRRARALGGDAVTFVATARAGDPELDLRIVLHRASRPAVWPVLEAGADLAAAVRSVPADRVLLLDSLTLWVSTLTEPAQGIAWEPTVAEPAEGIASASTLAERAEGIAARWDALDAVIRARTAATVIVSDEIGLGMVPLDAEARRFRDELGWLHQRVAERADEVWLMVAGLPLRVKGAP